MEERFETIVQEGMSKYLALKGLDLSRANSVQRGNSLTEFYIREIGQYLYGIYEGDIDDGLLCDGKGDLNIDFVYKNDKNILIMQSKFKGGKNELHADEITGFFAIHERIQNEELLARYANNAVKDAIGRPDPDSVYSYIFVSNAKATDWIGTEFARLKKSTENKFSNVNFEFKHFTEMKRDYRQVVSETETIEGDIEINIEKVFDTLLQSQKPAYLDVTDFLGVENGYQSIICTIKGTSLKHLWDEHKSKLFNYNIRGYLGQNPINKKIEDTLENEPDKFYYYNNGISAICTKIEPIFYNGEINKLRCTNFQIINGAQTTSTVARFKNPSKLQKVRVLLKITKAEDYKKEKGLNKNIVTFNNSQSVIKAADFRSNDEIQIFLEKKLQSFQYKGAAPYKDVRYIRKRIKVEKKNSILNITMETLARVLYAFEFDPVLIFKGTKYLFDIDETTGKYWLIFGEDKQETSFFDDKKTNPTVALYFLWTKIEDLLKEKSKLFKSHNQEDTIAYQALLAKWHFLWVYGYILQLYYSENLDVIYKRLANGKIFEKDNFINKWFDRIHKTIGKSIEVNYTSDNDDTVQGFNLKNWLRNSSDFEKLKKEFKWTSKEDYPIDVS